MPGAALYVRGCARAAASGGRPFDERNHLHYNLRPNHCARVRSRSTGSRRNADDGAAEIENLRLFAGDEAHRAGLSRSRLVAEQLAVADEQALNERVRSGTTGTSYVTTDQYAAAIERPPHLAAMYAAVGGRNYYLRFRLPGRHPATPKALNLAPSLHEKINQSCLC